MSYFAGPKKGYGWAAGHFLVDDERCTRQSMTVAANHKQVSSRDGHFVIPAGAVIPANDATAKGILYEDVDVTDGDKTGSIITAGTIYGDRLPAVLAEAAAKALTGITVVEASPAVTRPNWTN